MFEKVWAIVFLLVIVVAIAIVINLYEEFNSIEDELGEEKMRIKIIDLLNKIANGEEVPKKIKGRFNKIYTYSKYNTDYQDEEGKLLFYKLFQFSNKCLNDEVEIIEDEIVEDVPKEVNGIKKLNLTGENQLKLKTNKQEYNIRVVDKIIINKINEIIDKEY